MTGEILFLLVLLALTMVLFIFEWLSVDVVALLLVAALLLPGILTPEQAFSSFASDIIVVLASIFVLSGALVRTGVMEWAGKAIHRLGQTSESRVIGYLMPLSAGLSAFLSNTSTTAMLMPAVVEFSKEAKLSPSRLLMPLAYASMLGGSCTLLGTSTNLAASGLISQLGLQPISLFEFLPVGLAMIVAGTGYMIVAGRYLLPSRAAASFSEEYEISRYLSEILIEEESDLVDRRLREVSLSERGIHVMAIVRDQTRVLAVPSARLHAGDVLIVQATRKNLLELEDTPGLSFEASGGIDEDELMAISGALAEAIVMPGSLLVGRTLKETRFRERFRVSVLAVHRRGTSHPTEVGDLKLAIGDVLLLQGDEERFQLLEGARGIRLLGEVTHVPFRPRKGTLVLTAMVGAVVAGGSGLLPLSVAFLLAVLVVILTKCITAEEAYGLIEWRLIVLIGGMTSFGLAMTETAAADYVATQIATLTAPFGVYAVLAAFIVLTMVLTQPMSNAAAALVVLPVAVSTATQVGIDPRTLAVLVTLSASLSFITPLEPACLLVYSPGKYRFADFMKVGLPLSFVVFVMLLLLVPLLWSL